MESSATARKQATFMSSSSSLEAEVIEIDPPSTAYSTSKAKGKQKEVFYHEIIDVDTDEDCDDVVFLEEKFDSRKKRKGSMAISLGSSNSTKLDSKKLASNNKGKEITVDLSHSFKGFNPGSNNFFDLDDYVFDDDDLPLQTLFDDTPSNTQLKASVSQTKRVDSMPTSTMFSSSTKYSSSKTESVDDGVKKRYESFKRFDIVVDHSDHHYANQNSSSEQPHKNWAKKIQADWKILEKDLPDTIFVRVYESRMDLLRAVIIGAEETPYHDGLFFFDVCFPNSYPKSPPLVHYHSGGLRINPNLYDSGYVCLSLLNTWTGARKEKWCAKSTMLQVLVSIQGLVLNMKPYFNEPGIESSSGTMYGEQSSLQYNEDILILSLKTMVYTMNKPPKHFEDLVIGHFQHRVCDILMACKAYTEGVQVGSFVKGGIQGVNRGKNSCSEKFKKDVGSYIKTLVTAFEKIGAKEAQEFLFLSVNQPSYPSHGYAPFHSNSITADYNQHW